MVYNYKSSRQHQHREGGWAGRAGKSREEQLAGRDKKDFHLLRKFRILLQVVLSSFVKDELTFQ
jgi:hypothetical protein